MPRGKKNAPAPERQLTEAEIFYIKENGNSKTTKELADAIGVPSEVVAPYLEKTKTSRTRSLFINKTRGNKKGVNIMTEAASEMSDELKKLRPKKTQSHIYKPYGADYDKS